MEEKNVEKVEKKSNTLIIILVVIVCLCLGVGIGYLLFNNNASNTNKNETKETNEKQENENTNTSTNTNDNSNEISYDLVKELINIANLDESGPYAKYFDPIMFNDGLLADYDDEVKTMVVFRYAIRNKLTKSVEAGTKSFCVAGGVCTGVKISDFNKIAKKYGYDEFTAVHNLKNCVVDGDYYWTDLGGDTVEYSGTTHDVKATRNGSDIVLTDNMIFQNYHGEGDKTVTKEFTFKKANNDEYYLYSVYTK